MREIKFRAWNKEKNIMCYEDEDKSSNYLDGWCASDIQVINQIFDSEYAKERYDFMQYTGLKDKNGKQIYEKDIVTRFDSKTNFIVFYSGGAFRLAPTYNCKTLLEYEKNNYRYENSCYRRQSSSFRKNTEEFEVIGNIYENPDLLKEE